VRLGERPDPPRRARRLQDLLYHSRPRLKITGLCIDNPFDDEDEEEGWPLGDEEDDPAEADVYKDVHKKSGITRKRDE